MSRLIGTAGHVDHGKTTLIKALTGIDADRLPEERKRGMTIDIGFAYVDLPEIGRVSIVDVPGHEKFLSNMLVGALGIDTAVLCVAADEGVMPQTREHLEILELLPVQQLILAVTRSDLVDAETTELCSLEVQELLAQTRFAGAPVLPVSAVTGAGVDELRTALSNALTVNVQPEAGLWYMPIDRVFSVKGHGTVVTGTMARGIVRTGDQAVVVPGNIETRVRSIEWHDTPQGYSDHGRRTALNLGGVKADEIQRGQMIGAPGSVFETSVLDADVKWIRPIRHSGRVRVSIGSDEVIGRAFLSDSRPNVVQLRLERPAAASLGQPLIIRRYSPPDVLAGGRVTVPVARLRRKAESPDVIEPGVDLGAAVMQVLSQSPSGVVTDEVCRRVGKSDRELGDSFEALRLQGLAIGFAGLWFSSGHFANRRDELLAALEILHKKSPTRASIGRELVVGEARLPWRGKPLDRIVGHLAAEGALRVSGTEIALSGHRVQLNQRQRELLDRLLLAMRAAGINAPPVEDLARSVGAPSHAIVDVVELGRQTGEITRVEEGLCYPTAVLQEIRREVAERAGGQPFSAAMVRDWFDTTRRFVIPILEHFDSAGYTRRIGDMRIITD